MADGMINTDPGHQTTSAPTNMESETTHIAGVSPLAIARKSFGCVTFVDGPFKHISEDFVLFLKALLCAVPPSNADAINIQTHSDNSAMDNEPAIFVESATELAACPKSPTHQVDHAAPADFVLDVANHIEAINEHTIEASGSEAFNTHEISDVPVQEAAPSVATHVLATDGDETVFITQESLVQEYAPAETNTISATESVEFTIINDDVPVAEHTSESRLEDAAITKETQHESQQVLSAPENDATAAEETVIVQNDLVEVVSSIEDATADEEIAILQKDLVDSAIFTTEEATAVEETAILQNNFDSISTSGEATVVDETAAMQNDLVEAIKNLVAEDSDTDVKAVIRDILDWHPELDFETDLEMDLEPASPLDTISMEHTDNMPAAIPVPAIPYPIIFEDDFDAAVSSILHTKLERLLDIDITWSVPQIVEKGKSERDIIQERLADTSTAQFNRQNLRLEKAAQALSINGAAPMQIAPKIAAALQPAHKDSPSVTHIEPEREEVAISAPQAGMAEVCELITDHDDVAVQLSSSGMHSRNSSTSSAASKLSEPVFDSQDCPDTPVTEYCTSPNKVHSDQNTGDQLLEDAEETTE